MVYDWSGITSLAYETLIELKLQNFPIPIEKIKCKGVKIASYQKYSEKTDCSIDDLTLGNELEDAFFAGELRPGLSLILYDERKSSARIKHTLWHEVGHFKRKHRKHGEREEIEAHYFAAQVNAPNAIIKAISKNGYSIDTAFLVDCFGISTEAANKKMSYLNKYGFEHTNEYDDVLLLQFSDYIKTKYPQKAQKLYDDYFDEMEIERASW